MVTSHRDRPHSSSPRDTPRTQNPARRGLRAPARDATTQAAPTQPLTRKSALTEAAWHYRHPPRRPNRGPEPDQRAWQAQLRLYHRHRHLTEQGKRSTVVNIAVARELAAFLWAAMTDQPQRQEAAA
jgi:hypothetical protein